VSVYYFDSSAIVKRYIGEIGTVWVMAIMDPVAGHDIAVSLLARAEVPAAIFKRRREGSITAPDAAKAVVDFTKDFNRQYQPMDVTRATVEQAAVLAERHGLRGYDAVQLATVLEAQAVRDSLGLPRLIFVSADRQLNTAAQSEGLSVENPNDHP
jgi:hypothetical protein